MGATLILYPRLRLNTIFWLASFSFGPIQA
jgi:hypothetical protein